MILINITIRYDYVITDQVFFWNKLDVAVIRMFIDTEEVLVSVLYGYWDPVLSSSQHSENMFSSWCVILKQFSILKIIKFSQRDA